MKKEKVKSDLVKIIPLKDFKIVHNDFKYTLVKDVEIEIHRKFLENLTTEGVLK